MKRFLLNIFLVSLPVALLVGGIWVYYSRCVVPNLTRDLSRLALLPFPLDYEVPGYEPIFEYEVIPIDSLTEEASSDAFWTIGDSFSNRKGSDVYLGYFSPDSVSRHIVISNKNHPDNPMQTFVAMCNSDMSLPDKILIEVVQRKLVYKLDEIDFDEVYVPSSTVVSSPTGEQRHRSHRVFQQALECVMLRLGLYFNSVKESRLKTPMFTCRGHESDLYFYYNDLDCPTDAQISQAVDNLARVFELARQRGVDLCFLIAADKYEIYRPYIVDNKYGESDWLDRFAGAVDNPKVINSADTLRQMAAQGVADIYYCDDSHWTRVGSKAVATYLQSRIK